MNSGRFLLSLSPVLAGCLIAGAATAQPVVTTQSAQSVVEVGGVEVAKDLHSATDGYASSVVLYPSPPTSFQARTAARSRSTEIAANSRIFDDGYGFETFDLVISQANYDIELAGALPVRTGNFDFFLPPSELEIVSNAETRFLALETSMQAVLRVCFGASFCGSSDERFRFAAFLDGGYDGYSHGWTAVGDATLDLSPLRNPVVSDTGTGDFVRTVLVEFPAYSGRIEIGHIPANETLRVEYLLQTRASGQLAFSSAIAAINDPFTLDTDPVAGGAPISALQVAVVPEPATAVLAAAGVVVLACAVRRRRSPAARRSA